MRDVLLELQSASPRETAGPNYRWNNRVRNQRGAIVQYTFCGQGHLQRGRILTSCGPGQALIMREGDATTYFHHAEGNPPWEFAWINFTGAEELWRHLIRLYGDVANLDAEGETVTLLRQISTLYQTKGFQDRYHTSELLGRFLSSLGRELGAVRPSDTSPIRQAEDHLRDHHRRPINIKEVAARFHLSREHFSRLYREETGRTPAAFLRELRLQTARRLLRTTRMPVLEIAEQSGFGSSTHFCRTFKAAIGQTPESYRHHPVRP
jgi:AraC-like DNA-binding protein